MKPYTSPISIVILLCLLAGTPFISLAKPRIKPPLPKDASNYLAQPANPELPSLFLIGDSTVRNGNGTGQNGQWGWGDCMAARFDTHQINVVNCALGGTSSRTFYHDRWPGVKAMMKPGDFVIMQFGHNDASPINETEINDKTRARGTIDGTGPEAMTVTNILTKRIEVIHSYGWYLEQMISETRAHGATPMVCSLIPRNEWKDGAIRRDAETYAGWAGTVARSNKVPFLDINNGIADRCDALGQEKANALFAPDNVHTTEAGAKLNADCVISALKDLGENPLAPYLTQ